jgi:hypothetical protein
MTSCGFTYAHYRETLQEAARRYAFLTFPEAITAEAPARFLVLRHDVDFALEEALPLAELEAALGVRATYFVLPHGPYNLFGPPACSLLQRILALGHEIGLHYDVAFYGTEGGPSALGREAAALEARFGTRIRVVAEHNPGLAPRPESLNLADRLDAYAPEFTRDLKYVSDSCQFWREGCFCALVAEERPHPLELQPGASAPRVQVLTHPIWWSEDGRPADEALLALRARRLGWAEADARRVFAHFGSLAHLGNREVFRKHW